MSKVRVICNFMGGGFGDKGSAQRHNVLGGAGRAAGGPSGKGLSLTATDSMSRRTTAIP